MVGPDGNLLLTGVTSVADTFGFYLAKLDPLGGSVIWQRSYLAGSGIDPRAGLAVGPDGSVVVASAVFDADFDLDAAV